ncbi:putative UDP-glucuronosyltransferase 2A3 [Apodospora peruviana]|uniref:UDP-glucuronosyltransferase 2A3 n=1 Tax=Apodospora peruviana TaxID=516989 RepID=A0AAE0I0H1_9PEZI|nr:putative UDP-glucuronosyltransferase 2A3 [Apodospora peruviana]
MATKPLIVLTCTPGKGHVNPISTLAKALILEGYQVTAVSSTHYQPTFEALGCSYVAIQGYGDYWDDDRETKWPERAALPPGPEQFSFTIEHSFVRVIPDQFAAVQKAIATLKERHPGRPVVVLNESAFLGSLPFMRGAARGGMKPDGMIGIGINPVSLSSVDTAPFGPGLPPPTTPEQVAEYAGIKKHMEALFYTKPQAAFDEILRDLGATVDGGFAFDAPYLWPDRFLQMCPPSIMYPRSDAPDTFRYAGGLPRLPKEAKPRSEETVSDLPTWLQTEIVDNKTGKDIVFVCQGTVIFDYDALVVPTIEVMRERPNTLVVVVLGKRGAALPEHVLSTLPENVRVAEYLPYDEILPYSSVFVGNGGYGGVIHSVSHGTPMVLAGDTEDKAEMCAITAWAGAAVNLKTGRPTKEALRDGIEEVLTETKYKDACRKIQAEMGSFDPIRVVAQNINEVVAGFKG